jgi:hypothetical protein
MWLRVVSVENTDYVVRCWVCKRSWGQLWGEGEGGRAGGGRGWVQDAARDCHSAGGGNAGIRSGWKQLCLEHGISKDGLPEDFATQVCWGACGDMERVFFR